MKLILDILISLILIILLSPILILISILIFFESGFPIIHKRQVHSQPNRLFYFYKFRTMYNNADEELKILLKNDKKLQKEFNEFYKLKNDPRYHNLKWMIKNNLAKV